MLRRPTLAVTFLTGIPVPVKGDVSPADLWASMGWYPLVGLAMGAAAWGLFSGLTTFLPSPVAAVSVVLVGAVETVVGRWATGVPGVV